MPTVETVKKGGARFYVSPTQPNVTVPGVTSIISMLPKPFLQRWSANQAAELAVDAIDYLKEMVGRDPEGAKRFISGAAYRYTQARAKLGSRAHDAFERLMNGEELDYVHPDIRAHVDHFRQFLAAVNPELVRAEDVAWSYEHNYAGSFDAILRIWVTQNEAGDIVIDPTRAGTPTLVIVDYKTSKSTYPDVALQLAAYRHADVVIDPEGNEVPMPAIDSAAVLHITDEAWSFKGVRADDEVFQHFLTLKKTFAWDRDVSKTVLGKALAGSQKKMTTGTQRRA